MITIYKFPFAVNDQVVVEIPGCVRVLDVQCPAGESSGNTLCLWALVDTEHTHWVKCQPLAIRETGHPVDEKGCGDVDRTYWKTVQAGPFVWHVFRFGASV